MLNLQNASTALNSETDFFNNGQAISTEQVCKLSEVNYDAEKSLLIPLHYLSAITSEQWAFTHSIGCVRALNSATPSLAPDDFFRLLQTYMNGANTEALMPNMRAPLGTFSMLIDEVARCATLGDGLRQFVQSMRLLRPDLIANVRCGRGSLCLSISARQMMNQAAEIETEVFAFMVHCAFRALVDGPLSPVAVRAPRDGRFPGGIDGPSLLELIEAPLDRSGSGVTLEYSHRDGDQPISMRRRQLWAGHEMGHVHAVLAERPQAEEVLTVEIVEVSIVDRVRELLDQSIFNEPEISASLGMSTASLRRRMTAAGTSFRAVIDDHRKKTVDGLLYTRTPLADIASQAGYSDVRSLRRACAKWFGRSPGEMRRSQFRQRTL